MFFAMHCVIVTLGGVADCDTFLQRGRLSRGVYRTLEHLWEVESTLTTSHFESLDRYLLLQMCTCCMQAVKYFMTLRSGRGGYM